MLARDFKHLKHIAQTKLSESTHLPVRFQNVFRKVSVLLVLVEQDMLGLKVLSIKVNIVV
jgi:hypothetical protein